MAREDLLVSEVGCTRELGSVQAHVGTLPSAHKMGDA